MLICGGRPVVEQKLADMVPFSSLKQEKPRRLEALRASEKGELARRSIWHLRSQIWKERAPETRRGVNPVSVPKICETRRKSMQRKPSFIHRN
ncbi:hypothetical protein QR680_017546 [Steinernema hermaphroditum]|uniref:Uncharacterized protein n=1 Tax=Steinernema hermaphroditum TaxID=289476 RepID=A0AA39LPB9_9BILA|nr:hypothetical protein QR680_017546 [Steinernema hermaphroditum]